jgi:hypothetical protein
MGSVICKKRGRSSLSLVSPNVQKDAVNAERKSRGVSRIDVEYFDDLVQTFVVDEEFTKNMIGDQKEVQPISGEVAERSRRRYSTKCGPYAPAA